MCFGAQELGQQIHPEFLKALREASVGNSIQRDSNLWGQFSGEIQSSDLLIPFPFYPTQEDQR